MLTSRHLRRVSALGSVYLEETSLWRSISPVAPVIHFVCPPLACMQSSYACPVPLPGHAREYQIKIRCMPQHGRVG